MIIEQMYACEYDTKAERDKQAEEEIAAGALCVVRDHDPVYFLEVYRPRYWRRDFKGGYYEQRGVTEHFDVTEAEAYEQVANYLKAGETFLFTYNFNRRLAIFHFRRVGIV